MYANAKSCVKISRGKTTAGFPCQKGVRQGCNLSPLLFNLFTSDLELELGINNAGVEMFNTRLDLLMYADDIILLSQSAAGLQKHLKSLQSFCQKWKLEVNTEKTKICIFGRSRYQGPFLWKDFHLETVQTYCYLGIWFSKNGKFNKARQHISQQARKASHCYTYTQVWNIHQSR